MSEKKSMKSLRIRDLPLETSLTQLEGVITTLAECGNASFDVSLATQGAKKTATITFQNIELKKNAEKRKGTVAQPASVDDTFLNLTVLHCAENATFDVCAVHGLDGHAFDTWMAKNGRMWLRDFLPRETPFHDHSRIMTFGYTSALVGKSKMTDRLEDYAHQLMTAIILLRGSTAEQSRPLIFVCHSMGGLVARLAMARMHTLPGKYESISLKECGLLFLSTPHVGSSQADWNPFLLAVGQGLFGLRTSLIKELQSFNPSEVDNKDIYEAMEIKPIFRCFCESEPTKIKGKDRQVVTQASAGFLNQTAEKLMRTDHHTVCKFENTLDNYEIVVDGLKKIQSALVMRLAVGPVEPTNFGVPGQPNVTTHSFPPFKKYYLGAAKYGRPEFVGRAELCEELKQKLSVQDQSTAIVGIGGMGKTELLLKVASQYKDVKDVFFLPASSYTAFQKTFNDMAQIIGHDILKDRHAYPEIHQLWISLGESGQAREFKNWLGSSRNRDSIIILDDLDGLRNNAAMMDCLPDGHKSVVYSARDPTISKSRWLQSKQILVPAMNEDDTIDLLKQEAIQKGLNFTSGEIAGLLNIVDGHPLAAARAVSFIEQLALENNTMNESSLIRLFVSCFENEDWQSRNEFLQHRIHFGPSIKDIFEVSIDRLDKDRKVQLLKLMELLSFICGAKPLLDYIEFLSVERPWLTEIQDKLPDYDTFSLFLSGMRGTSNLFQELEKVSLVFKPFPNHSLPQRSILRFHPIWLECIRQRCGDEGRKRWLKQILFICYTAEERRLEGASNVNPYVANCIEIARAFGIELERLVGNICQ